MKRILLSLMLLVLAGSAFALEPCKSGSYYNPVTDGTGIDLQVSEDVIVLYRYAYLAGHADYWVGAVENDNSGEWVFDMNQTFATNDGVGQAEAGTTVITELENGNLLFSWNWSFDHGLNKAIPWCLGAWCSGEEELIPLFLPHKCE